MWMLIMNVYRQDCSKFENLKKWVVTISSWWTLELLTGLTKKKLVAIDIHIEETSISSIFYVWMLSQHVWLIVKRWEFASKRFPLLLSTFYFQLFSGVLINYFVTSGSHFFLVMRWHDLTKKYTYPHTYLSTYLPTYLSTYLREHPQGGILETCDLYDIWSEWWGDLTWWVSGRRKAQNEA